MKININIEKKHLIILILILIIFAISYVIATGYSGQQSHSLLFTDTIRGKGGDTVTVDDKLSVTASPTLSSHVVTKSYADTNYKDPPGQWTCTNRFATAGTISTVSCVGNEKVIVGGCFISLGGTYSNLKRDSPNPSAQGWACELLAPTSYTVSAWANCCL